VYSYAKVMMRHIYLFVFLITLGSPLLADVQAALDATRWRPSQAETSIWWDNIEGAPLWVRGPKPEYDQAWTMHTISLPPGQTVVLRLPQGRALRVYHPAWRLTLYDLNFSLSNGSGLYVDQLPQVTNDPHSLILAPNATEPLEIHISRGSPHQKPLRVAFFLSRYDPLPVAPYRDAIALDLPMAQLQTSMYGSTERFWSLKPDTSVQVKIEGPVHLAIENRLVYEATIHQPKQTYHICTRLNHTHLRVLEFATDVQISQPVYIDDAPQQVSRLEVDYVDIPPGFHTFELQSTAPIYLRLLRQSRADYLFPEANRPPAPNATAGVLPRLLYTPIWDIAPQDLSRIITSSASSVVELAYLAKRLWRDNRHQDGGLQAAMLLQNAAALHPYDTMLQQAASRQLSASTLHQDLLPEHKIASQPQYFGWYTTPRLAPLDDDQEPYTAAKQHQDSLLSQMESGYFVPLSAYPQIHHYILPPRSAPSELRFVADRTTLMQSQELWLQYDDQPPIRLQIRPGTTRATTPLLPAPGTIGLTLLREKNPAYDNGTLGGPFASHAYPARFLRAAHATWSLPAHVQRVKVWQTAHRSEVVSIALQYRASKTFRLSEYSYLDALQRVGSPAARHALLLKQMTALQYGPATFDLSSKTEREAIEVMNQWQPLMRLLRARYQRFVSTLTPLTTPLTNLPRADMEQIRHQAQQAEANDDWLTALEIWAPLANVSQETYRREAQMGQVQALQRLGRHALANQMLRGMMLFDTDARLRLQAFDRLLAFYHETADTSALGALVAVAAIRQQHPDALSMLITQLVANGQDQYALQLGLALPVAQRPLTPLLQSAWRLGWWQAFDEFLHQLKTDEERHYWLGYHAVHQADYETAQHHFLQASDPGQALAEAIVQAQRIHTDLRSQDAMKQEMAVLHWEAWQASTPGPHTWQNEPQVIADYAGSIHLYHPVLDFYSEWYRSEADRPVQLNFLGPLRLRLTARPLHPKSVSNAPTPPYDGWITVHHNGQRDLIPIIDNDPSSEYISMDGSSWQSGQRITEEFNFGPGPHTVIVSGQTIPLLIQTEVQRPALPLGILPPLTPSTLHAMLHLPSTNLNSHKQRGRSCTTCLYLTDIQQSSGRSLIRSTLVGIPDHQPSQSAHDIHDDLVNLQRRLRTRRPFTAATASEQMEQRQFDLRQHMAQLLWQADHQPERYEEALSAAQSLLSAHPNDPYLFTLFAHLARRSEWQRIATVQSSAGVHYIEYQGWHPESPWLRVNKALLGPIGPDEHIVTGQRRLLVALNNLKSTTFEISMGADALPYGPRRLMTAVYQIDAQPPIQTELTPGDNGRTLHLTIPAGQHALRFYIQEPENQFLWLKMVEQDHTSAHPLQHTFERAYHVATPAEPVVVVVAGPSWLRVDRWRDTGVQTHYQTVAAGWQTLKFYPEPGQRETLLRLYHRVPAPEAVSFKPQQPLYEPEWVLDPLVRLGPLPHDAFPELYDAYPLGQQEDGTWTFGAQLVSRRNSQEDVSLSEAERFLALGLTHRYFDSYRHLYLETEAVGRVRTDGGPTLGLQHVLAYRPNGQDFALRVSATGFVQLPTRGTDLAGSGIFRLSASRGFDLGSEAAHLPTLSIFARLLSLDESQARASDGRIDLDIFSTFKADHRVGLNLSDTFTYRPWLDTIWSSAFDVVTNEDFNLLKPDHMTLQLEWKQLLGALQLNSAYRFGYFLADDDRRYPIDRHTLIMEAQWEYWRPSQQRMEIQLQMRYDIREGDFGFLLGFSWHMGPGRAYRDFRPGSIHFRRLRQYRIPTKQTNRLIYVETS
jgi:hypothetical protein